MSTIQFNQYKNLNEFATTWRGYTSNFTMLDEDAFRKQMQSNQYIRMDYINKFEKPVQIYLLTPNSKYNNNQVLKQLLVKIKDPTDVILVTEQPLKKYTYDNINTFKHLRVKGYLHRNFDVIMPNVPLAYRHRIMSKSEVLNLLNNELRCSLINLPKILSDDVQIIWIAAEVCDVVEIRALSDIMGESIRYHVVVPRSGRVISFRQDPIEEKKEEEEELEIEDVHDNASVIDDTISDTEEIADE